VRREYSLAHLTVLGCAPPEVVRIASSCGYDYVGLRTIPLGLPGEPRHAFAEDRAMLRETRAALRETGVRLLDIEVAVLGEDRDPAAYRRAMEDAAELGARHLLCNVWSGERGLVEDQFAALCELAAPLGLRVECEFVTFSKVVGLADALALVEAAGDAASGVVVDTLHFARSGIGLDELDRAPKGRFHYLQICDAPPAAAPSLEDMKRTARQQRLYPGEGIAPIREIVARLPDRPLALEVAHPARRQALGAEGFAAECLRRAKLHLES
jgi:sugar phosphate isomerase/epimerase